jgi:hypothetical protein
MRCVIVSAIANRGLFGLVCLACGHLRLRIPIAPEKDAEKTLNTASVNLMIHNVSLALGSFVALWKVVNAVFF